MADEFDTMTDGEMNRLINSEGMKKLRALRDAEDEAREKAGVKDTAGYVEFTCPNCGSVCVSNFYPHRGELHGGMGCSTCQVGIRI